MNTVIKGLVLYVAGNEIAIQMKETLGIMLIKDAVFLENSPVLERNDIVSVKGTVRHTADIDVSIMHDVENFKLLGHSYVSDHLDRL